jgi:TRAP-type uncharacterized transport system fused permease subunit
MLGKSMCSTKNHTCKLFWWLALFYSTSTLTHIHINKYFLYFAFATQAHLMLIIVVKKWKMNDTLWSSFVGYLLDALALLFFIVFGVGLEHWFRGTLSSWETYLNLTWGCALMQNMIWQLICGRRSTKSIVSKWWLQKIGMSL